MSVEVTIARLDVFTSDGKLDSTLYEVRVNQDGEFIQDIQLESPDELAALRDAISAYLNLYYKSHERKQED